MDRRIYGLETEYGVACTSGGTRRLTPDEVARYLFRRVVSWGRSSNVFLRNGDTVYRTWHTNGRGTEQLSHSFALIDILPWGRQEEWLDSPEGWPSRPTYSGWLDSPDIARAYGTAD